MNTASASSPKVLRLGPAASTAIDQLLRALDAEPVALRPEPPTDAAELRALVRGAKLALLDFDTQPAGAIAWLRILRSRCPALPIAALHLAAPLEDLIAAGALGLDAALTLPVKAPALTELVRRWIPAPPPRAAPPPAAPAPAPAPLPARHLSPLSSDNQRLLAALREHADAPRLTITGPVGAEFTLLALEIAAARGFAEETIAFDGAPASTRTRLLVTTDPARFANASAECALLVCAGAAGGTPPPGPPRLELAPLRRRLPDLAYYCTRWFPVFAHAAGRPGAALPFPAVLRSALLRREWTGEFAELWETLARLALVPPDAPLPPDLAPAAADADFAGTLAEIAPRLFRDSLSPRVPAGLLPALLAALDCPEPSALTAPKALATAHADA